MMITIYEAAANSDRTEGRGSMVGFAYFDNEDAAVAAVKGAGTMGMGDGDVYAIELYGSLQEYLDASAARDELARRNGRTFIEQRKKVYGYRKDWNGQWGYGYTDNRDAPVDDPDYATYIKLKNKFDR